MSDIVSCGEWVQKRRNQLGLSRSGLAQQVGCSPVTIFAILSKPTPDRLAWRSDVPAALVRLIEEMLVKEREGRMSLGDALPGCMRQVAAELDKIRDSV
jgi:hypothetical protein